MLEILKFIFANPLHFFGFFILLALPCSAIANIGVNISKKHNTYESDCKNCTNYIPKITEKEKSKEYLKERRKNNKE
jgi:hypothetical protein